MARIVNEIQDLRHLKWSYNRHSSGTAGSFLKSYEIQGNHKTYYKLSNYNTLDGIFGHECINELVVDRLLDRMNIEHLSYDLIHAVVKVDGNEHETYLCSSHDFKNRGEGKIAFDIFFEMNHMENESPIQFVERLGWMNYFSDMFLIDYLILNRDRHGANVEVLKNRITQEYRLAPIFDNGLSLLFNCLSEQDIGSFDVMEDRRVQCYWGSNSLTKNLALIHKDYQAHLPEFNQEFKEYLFHDLDNIVSECWKDKTYELISRRAEYYENLRTV